MLNIKTLTNIRPNLLKLRLLEGLTNKGKSNFDYCMNLALHMPEINQLFIKLNGLVINMNKISLKEIFSFCNKNNRFIEKCEGSDFDLAFYYIKFMIEYCKNKTNFILIFDDEEIPFIFEKIQYNKIFLILKLNEKDNIFLSIDTVIKYYKAKKKKMDNA